jgi:hypothetical protein
MLPYLPEGKEQADILLALGRIDDAREIYRKLGLYENLLSLSRGSPSEDEEIRVRELMPMTEENRSAWRTCTRGRRNSGRRWRCTSSWGTSGRSTST